MMNPILKEIVILEVKDYLTDEALADFATKEYDVEGAALIKYINLNYVELFDNPPEKTQLILEDNDDVYDMYALISEFQDAYFGTYNTVEEFAEDFYEQCYGDSYNQAADSGLLYAVDWNRYWTNTLQFDYYFHGEYFFRNL